MSETVENNHPRERTRDPDNDPPNSRLFIVCSKSTEEKDLEPRLRQYGNLTYVKVVRDKNTNEHKGIAYAKFEKASSAALAVEALHDKKLEEDQPALKVLVADAKGTQSTKYQSKEPEDTPPRSRLFVICSKDFTQEELAERFKLYGDLEYCKLITDKDSGESKGYAYVKYYKASHAAVAVEEVGNTVPEGVKLKALVADPKGKPRSSDASSASYSPMPVSMPYPYGPEGYGIPGQYGLPPRQRLFVVCSKAASSDQLARLFGRYPGMEYCDLKKNKQTGESKGFAYINYSTPQAAMMARDYLDGYEFPHGSGSHLKVLFADPLGVKGGPNEHPSVSAIRDGFQQMHMVPGYPPSMAYPPAAHSIAPTNPKQSGIDRNFPEGSRLFVVLSKPLPDWILQHEFSRFGPLEYVRLQKDKNYGYAKYTSPQHAQNAINYLNNTEIQGNKIRIQVANPPNDATRKRQRVTQP